MNLTSNIPAYARAFSSPFLLFGSKKNEVKQNVWGSKSFAEILKQNNSKDVVELKSKNPKNDIEESTSSISTVSSSNNNKKNTPLEAFQMILKSKSPMLTQSPSLVYSSWFPKAMRLINNTINEIKSAHKNHNKSILHEKTEAAQEMLELLKPEIPQSDLVANIQYHMAYANLYPDRSDVDKRIEEREKAHKLLNNIPSGSLKKQQSDWVRPALALAYFDKASLMGDEKTVESFAAAAELLKPLFEWKELNDKHRNDLHKKMAHMLLGQATELINGIEANQQMSATLKQRDLEQVERLCKEIRDTKLLQRMSNDQRGSLERNERKARLFLNTMLQNKK